MSREACGAVSSPPTLVFLQLPRCPLLDGGTSGGSVGIIEAGPPLRGGRGPPHFWLPDAVLLSSRESGAADATL